MKDYDSALSSSDTSSSSSEESQLDLAEGIARFRSVFDSPASRLFDPGQTNESAWLEAMYPAERRAAPSHSARINSPFVGQSNLTGQSASSQYPSVSTQAAQRLLRPSENPALPRRAPHPPSIYQSGDVRDYDPDSRAPINQRLPMSDNDAGLSTSNPRFHQWLQDNWQHTIEYVLPPEMEDMLFQQWCQEQRSAERQQQPECLPTLSEDTPEDPFSFAEQMRILGPEVAAMGIREPIQLDFVPPGPTASRTTASAITTSTTMGPVSATGMPTTTAPTTTASATSPVAASTPSAPSTVTSSTTTNTAAVPTTKHNAHPNVEEKQSSDDKWEF